MRRGAAVVVAAAAAVAGSAVAGAATSSATRVGTATAACAAHTFTVAFDPKRSVVVSDGAGTLASASFTSRTVSGRCRRVAEPRGYVGAGLGSKIHARTTFRCLANRPVWVHVNPIRDGATGKTFGSALEVGLAGAHGRLRVIVSAVLKDKGDPRASRVYRAAAYCKLGA